MNSPNNTIKRSPAEPAGFTFIEVVIAMAVVAIALTALIRLQLISINATATADATTRATLIAQEKIDQALAEPFEKVSVTRGTIQQAGRNFKWQTHLTDAYPANINKNDITPMRQIKVKVNWKQGSHRKEISLCTYRTEGNIE